MADPRQRHHWERNSPLTLRLSLGLAVRPLSLLFIQVLDQLDPATRQRLARDVIPMRVKCPAQPLQNRFLKSHRTDSLFAARWHTRRKPPMFRVIGRHPSDSRPFAGLV